MRKGIVAGGGYCNGINYIPSLAQICKAWNALVGKLYRFWKKYHPLSLWKEKVCNEDGDRKHNKEFCEI